MALNSIEKEFEGFAAMVFRKMTPAVNQREEMQKAFFAGDWAMLTAFREIGEPHVSEEEGVAYMEARWQEAMAFKARILAEYASTN